MYTGSAQILAHVYVMLGFAFAPNCMKLKQLHM